MLYSTVHGNNFTLQRCFGSCFGTRALPFGFGSSSRFIDFPPLDLDLKQRNCILSAHVDVSTVRLFFVMEIAEG